MFSRLCPCCGMDPEHEAFPVCSDNMSLAEIGEGYVLLFKLMLYLGWIGVLFDAINVYKVVINVIGGVCINYSEMSESDLQKQTQGSDPPPCFLDWTTVHSIANFGIEKTDIPERIAMLAFWGIFWPALSLFTYWVKQIDELIDSRLDTPSDFTIMVRFAS